MDLKNTTAAVANSNPDLTAIMADLAALRADLAKLAIGAKASTLTAAEAGALQMRAEAGRMYDGLSDAGKKSVTAVEQKIDDHPIMSLMLAFALGAIGSRLLAR